MKTHPSSDSTSYLVGLLQKKLDDFLGQLDTGNESHCQLVEAMRLDLTHITHSLGIDEVILPYQHHQELAIPPEVLVEGEENMVAQIKSSNDLSYLEDCFSMQAASVGLRYAALDRINQLGGLSQMESLLKNWDQYDNWAKCSLINRLGEMGNNSTATKVKNCLNPNGDEAAKLAAVHALCKIGGKGVTYVTAFLSKNIFSGNLDQEKLKIAEEAALALGDAKDEQAIGVLNRLLEYKSEYPTVVKNSIIALGKIGYSKGYEKVLPIIKENDLLKDAEVVFALKNLMKASEGLSINAIEDFWEEMNGFPLVVQLIRQQVELNLEKSIDELGQVEFQVDELNDLASMLRKNLEELLHSSNTQSLPALDEEDAIGLIAKLKESKYYRALQVFWLAIAALGGIAGLLKTLDELSDGGVRKWLWGNKGEVRAQAPKKRVTPPQKVELPTTLPTTKPAQNLPKVWPSKRDQSSDDSSDDTFH